MAELQPPDFRAEPEANADILKSIWDEIYRDPETGKICPDRDINGGDMVDYLLQILPPPHEAD